MAAIVAAAELTGVLQTPDSLRQKPIQEHRSEEEGEASSPKVFFRLERARSSVAAWGGREGVGEIQNRPNMKLGLGWG